MDNKKPPILSCIMVACDGLPVTINAIESLYQKTKSPFELIVIDNATTDGTSSWLPSQGCKIVRTDVIIGYAKAVNLGLKEVDPKSKFISILNNDIVLSENWDRKLIDIIEHPELSNEGCDKIGISAPMSNNAPGAQMLIQRDEDGQVKQIRPHEIDIINKRLEIDCRRSGNPYYKTGFVSGFCMMMSRECVDIIGDWDSFPPYHHGFEDNDYCYRAEHAGFAIVICRNTLVFHHGRFTELKFNKVNEYQSGLSSREAFFKKYYNPTKKNLIAGYRVKNGGIIFQHVLKKMNDIADKIIVFDDHSTDNTESIAKEFDKVIYIKSQFDTFDEHRDREFLLQEIKKHGREGIDWGIITDADEELCEKCTREAFDKLMSFANPMIYAYDFHSETFWNDFFHIRVDDRNFGNAIKTPMFKLLPNQHILNIRKQPQGFHCGSHPPIKDINRLPTVHRLKHYGYVDPVERKRKYDFYQAMDTKKDPLLIGNVDYRHLIDEEVRLVKYNPNQSVSFTTIVLNEATQLHDFISNYCLYFDEMVFVDTGSIDGSQEIINFYEPFNVKLINFKWIDDYAAARNAGLKECKSDWVYYMDLDERFGELTQAWSSDKFWLHRLIRENKIAYCVPKLDYHKPGIAPQKYINIRLFRNLPEIYFDNYVHESILNSLNKMDLNEQHVVDLGDGPPLLFHTAYLKDPKIVAQKLKKYTRLVEKQLARNPNDAFAHNSMALHYENEGELDKALYHFGQSLIHNPKFIENTNCLVNFKLREIMELIKDNEKYLRQGQTSRQLVYIHKWISETIGKAPVVGLPARLTKQLEELNNGM